MIPDNELSSRAVVSGFSFPVKQPGDELVDWELGGVDLNDPSQGLMVKLWKCQAAPNSDTGEIDVTVTAPGVDATVLFSDPDITEVALTFDQNMHPFVAYMKAGQPWMYWYDPTVPGMTHTALPSGCYDLRCTLDDKRSVAVDSSDIVLAYIRASNLCVRYQRERFETEHVMRAGVGSTARLVSMAMNNGSRLQFRLRNYALTDDPGALLQADPYLADVVADLLRRSDVPPHHVDVSQLWVPIEGFRIANEGGADANIMPLQQAWFFDPGEWDKKLRFIMRGAAPVAHITYNDLLEREGASSPMQMERVQEVELLRKVNITMVDSTAGWIANKQTAERRSATIKAVGESSSILPITAHPDFAATVATKRLRVPWGEPHKFKYGLGTPWSKLTPTDVITYEDQRGRVYQIRIGQSEEDYGSFQFESQSNARWIYDISATGAQAKPWVPTVPGQAGDTVVVVMDIPVVRDQDDELGCYVAVFGTGNGWSGGLLQISTDGGATIAQSLDVTMSSSVGTTASALVPEESSEYLSSQVLRVTINDPLESITREDILRYRNLGAVQRTDGSWELLQWQTATQVSPTVYELSGLIRGRYATKPLDIPVGAKFVVIDSYVQFVQLQQWMLGRTIHYRGVTYNQNADDVPWQSFVVASPQTQVEWPVHYVRAERHNNNVTVSWIGRARLGVEVAPRHSKHFAGYRVKFSNGRIVDLPAGASGFVQVPVPADLSGWVAEHPGWDISEGMFHYSPEVSGESTSRLYKNDSKPFVGDMVFTASVDVTKETAVGGGYSVGAAYCAYLNYGVHIGGAAGNIDHPHSVVTAVPGPSRNQCAVGMIAITDGTQDVFFYNLEYAISGGETDTMRINYNNAPTGITVAVCALNAITGEGPYSEPIAV